MRCTVREVFICEGRDAFVFRGDRCQDVVESRGYKLKLPKGPAG